MEPDLTDVGSTLEEALQLRQEHNEMLAKLKASHKLKKKHNEMLAKLKGASHKLNQKHK